MSFHTVNLPLATILFAASLAAQVVLEPRVSSETLPSGGLTQIKVDITSPHPIITGGAQLEMSPYFDGFEGVSAFSPAGDVYGAALLRGRTFVANLVSPLGSLGTQLDYPFLAVAARIQPGIPEGTEIPIAFNSLSFFTAPGGTPYSYLVKNGVLTIGGSISVTNVIPGGGVLPAGTTVRVLGTGFDDRTQLAPGTLQIANFRYVSPTELRFEMAQAGNVTAQRLKVKNPADNDEVTYFSYLRAVPVGASSSALLNATHPLFAEASSFTSAVLTVPTAPAPGFVAVALQNASLTQTSVLLQLFSQGGASLGSSSVIMPPGSRWSRTLAELFGSAPAAGSTVRITSPVALQVLGLSGDDSLFDVTAFAAAAAPSQGSATLTAAPASFHFAYQVGGALPAAQQVNLTSSAGPATFTTQSNATWLSIAGSAISVNPANLGAGQYNGTITVESPGAQALAIPVTLTVTASSGGGGALPAANGLRFVPVPPCRLVDTRINAGAFGAPVLAAGASRSFALPQHPTCGIPAGALAYSLNVTVVPRGRLDYLTIFPTGAPQPFVSTLNSADGRIKANAALVPAGTGGAVSVFVTNETDMVMDVNGYFVDSASALAFYPLPPCRIADTRNPASTLGGPALPGGTSRTFPVISSNCGVPANAEAFSLNATVVPSGPLGFLTLWPAGQGRPLVSTLNSPTGDVVANAAIVPSGTGGAISAYATNQTHLVLDINGYFAPPGQANAQRFFPSAPCRLVDTRVPAGEFGGPALAPGQTRDFRLPLTPCGLPPGVGAYSLNATVVPQSTLGYLTLWPSGAAQPLVSTLNALGDSIVANAALVPAGSAGGVSGFATDTTHLVLDLNGYFAP